MPRDRCPPGRQSLATSRHGARPRRRARAAAPGACISDRAGRSPGPCRRAPALLVLAATSCCCSSRCATELLLVVSATSRRRTRGSEAVCGSPGTRAMMLQVTGAARRRLRESWRVLDRCLVHQRSRKAYAAKSPIFLPASAFTTASLVFFTGTFLAVQLNLAYKLAASICATPLTALCRCGRRAVASRAVVLFVQHTTVTDPNPRSGTDDDRRDTVPR